MIIVFSLLHYDVTNPPVLQKLKHTPKNNVKFNSHAKFILSLICIISYNNHTMYFVCVESRI